MAPVSSEPVVQTAHWISSITMMMRKQRKDRTYSEFPDAAVFTKLDVKEDGGNLVVTANYKLGNLDKTQWTINPSGELALDYTYNFSGVVDLMGIRFDYPEDQVISKRWLGAGPYRVWQNRIHGTQYDVWENDYNDPIPGETFHISRIQRILW